MGCVLCGRRQVDPASGPSDWKRAVLDGTQVLVCPECQQPGWADAFDRCDSCGSTALVRRLGETSCRGCGAVDRRVPGPGRGGVTSAADPARASLESDVAAALDRVLGRGGET